ncbi:kinase-like protein [Rhizophagus irregularis]|uniref:Kinase-like protein n=1 Tax=Rhizophagus irregularis TaxID=588596 RepID=A0A2N0P3K3_9GLOM|nr:kinase-like protein [Rhizophagus irregularis]
MEYKKKFCSSSDTKFGDKLEKIKATRTIVSGNDPWAILVPIDNSTAKDAGTIYLFFSYNIFGKNDTCGYYNNILSDEEYSFAISKNEFGIQATRLCVNLRIIHNLNFDINIPPGQIFLDDKQGPSAESSNDLPCINHGYKFIRQLGKGGYGIVYLMENKNTGKQCAVKFTWNRSLYNEFLMMNLVQDIKYTTKLIDGFYYTTNKQQFIVTDCIKHGSLRNYILSKYNFSDKELLAIASIMSTTLKEMHQKGLIHRDIKPANILVSETNPFKVVLADFGMTKVYEEGNKFGYSGTRSYMSPESLNNIPYNHFHDYWALGVTLLECSLGKNIFFIKPKPKKDEKTKSDEKAKQLTKILTCCEQIHSKEKKINIKYEKVFDIIRNLIQIEPYKRKLYEI